VIRVAIYGASGYTGQELIRLLARHPQCELAAITSRRYAGMKVTDIYPHLRGYTDLSFADSDPAELASQCQVVFLALPHGVSMTVAETFLDAGVKVIDLSADFRIRKAPVYKSWYQEHKAPHLLPRAVYGLPELYRDEIRTASLIANPGCYPTSIILGLAPLLGEDWVDPTALIADSKSGTSGAGREPLVTSLFCEVNESFKAYKIGGTHRHIPEIEQELSALAGQELTITFSPHLLPVTRGILSTLYAPLVEDRKLSEVLDLYHDFYRDEPFVRLYPAGQFPTLSAVRGSNYCDLGLTIDKRSSRVIVLSAIDNLIKGASGQAVQNMNLIAGLDERTGLDAVPLYP